MKMIIVYLKIIKKRRDCTLKLRNKRMKML